jgi:hypothetical protein
MVLACSIKQTAVGIPSSIARGVYSREQVEWSYSLDQVLGRLGVLDTEITLACDLGYLDESQVREIETAIREFDARYREFLTPLKKAYDARIREARASIGTPKPEVPDKKENE